MPELPDSSLFALFRQRNAGRADATCLTVPDGTSLSFGEVEDRTGRLAAHLAELGLAPGDRLVAQIEKSPDALLLYLACLRAGGVFVPLNTAYKDDELAYFLGDAEPSVVVADPHLPLARAVADTPAGRTRADITDGAAALLERAIEQAYSDHVVPRQGTDPAAIVYTSGTTGQPKGAVLSQENLAANAVTLQDAWGFSDTDVLLHALPIFHVHGLFVAIHCALIGGAPMIFLPRFDAAQVVTLLPRASVYMGVPTHYTRMLDQPGFGSETCRNMRLFVSGSAPLLAETWSAFQARTGHPILERYGMTETGMNCSNPLDGNRRPGTVGPPLPGVRVRVCDEDGSVLADGETGELEVAGPNVFAGYWRKPEATAESFRADGFFRTGDIARIDEDGYVAIVGRAKDMIISGGLNVYPKELENLLDEIDGVGESAVVAAPHPDLGEGVVAVLTRDGKPDLDEAAVVDEMKQGLAGFKVAKKVLFVDALPRNVMGKVLKNELREMCRDVFRPS